jgi:2-amino-4-hydroxy-6-hydroxymethyldihydropteridine diphosphokinase
MADAYVAAGSNVRPRASLTEALRLLSRDFPGLAASRAYSNPAIGFQGDDFINLVVRFPADLPTETLLERLKSVERACGREPGATKWGPRTLDLDLLLHGDVVGRVAGKVLPHPDLLTRAWVLGPLAELAPALVHPVTGERMDALWRQFDQRAHPLTPAMLDGAGE